VITCAQCGQENPETARFCNSCAAPLDAGSERAREAVARAGRAGDRRLEARAQVRLGFVRIQTGTSETHDAIQRELEPLVTLFEAADDHRGAADILRLLGRLATGANDYEAGSELHERALLHTRAAGDERRQAAIIRQHRFRGAVGARAC
jgi:Double zinc ribbon